ncbi:uncharacterized protein LOC133202957 [Saccostrea echinata]|uniref:uncharacterized protein LOC133202957 n=1 Tax=Saccostrea echinata TaxID=191078 RepID=UPI002A7F20BF|nr:uncharacterized protein LOC133202957 [Saccostrea echinata]
MQRAFLKHLYKSRCKLQEEDNTMKFIESGVRDFVAKTCKLVGEAKPIFQISQIIPSGSFYEGTKIGRADEFDFMVILKGLSEADKLILHNGCNPWYTRLQLKRGIHFGQRYMCNCHMNRETYGNYLGNPQILVADFWSNISSVSKSDLFCRENSDGKLCSKVNEKQKLLFKYTEKPLMSQSESTEAGLVPLNDVTIGVDMMMAIKHPSPETIASQPSFPSQFKELLLTHGCHIITKSCHIEHFPQPTCWFITFSALELELMKNMDTHHKECYKILKSLMIGEINFPGKCMNLSSYVLKTAFLFHVYGTNKCTHSRFDAKCIIEVLNYLANCLFHFDMPCFFARDMNTWGYLFEVPCFIWPEFSTGKYPNEIVTFALCWMKMWYKIVLFIKEAISKENINKKAKWMVVTDKCDYIKGVIFYVLERYSTSSLTEVYKGHLPETDIADLTLASCSEEKFTDYIQNMKKHHNIQLEMLL